MNVVLMTALGMISAAYFGTSAEKDSFVAAQVFPNLLLTLLVGGIYPTLVVSLTRVGQERGAPGQIAFLKKSIVRVSTVLVPITILVVIFPRGVLAIVAPGFGSDRLALAGDLLRLAMVAAAGSVYLALFRSLFNARHRFALPGLLNVLVAGLSIAALVHLVDRFGIYALAIGPVAGSWLAVVLVGLVTARGSRTDPQSSSMSAPGKTTEPGARAFWTQFALLSVSANFGQVNLLADKSFASLLAPGSVAILGYVVVIVSNSILLTTVSLADVALPRLAAADRNGVDAVRSLLRSQLRYIALMTVPQAAGLLVFGVPITRLLLERGEFGADATTSVALLLAIYSPDLILRGYVSLYWRLLIARNRLSILAWSSAAAIVANIVLDAVLMRHWGLFGIAAATPFVSFLHALYLARIVRREVGGIHRRDDLGFLGKAAGAAVLMGILVLAWTILIERHFDVGLEKVRVLQVAGGLAIGVAAYMGLLLLAGVQEARSTVRRIGRVLGYPGDG